MELTITELWLIHDCMIKDVERIEKEIKKFHKLPWEKQDYAKYGRLITRKRDVLIAAHKIMIEIENYQK